MRNRLPLFLVKLFYYEYWPFWLFFMPLVPWWIFLSIRARCFTYFTAANPGIPHSGVFGESKSDILGKIDKSYLPITLAFQKSDGFSKVKGEMDMANLNFPIVAKPDVGERGSAVEKLDDEESLKHYLLKNDQNFIIQEFVVYDLELGVLYYRLPDGSKSGITSIVRKEFLGATGDGKHTIRELLSKSERARLQMADLENRFGDYLETVLEDGEYVNLQPIGNHCLGTKFLSGQELINDQLVSVFDKVAAEIDGFYHGRFDLKVSSVDDLMEGKNIKVLELNGVTSEPGHIYDPKFNLLRAYKDTMSNMYVTCTISIQNMKRGVKATPFMEMFRIIRGHFSEQEPETKMEGAVKPAMTK